MVCQVRVQKRAWVVILNIYVEQQNTVIVWLPDEKVANGARGCDSECPHRNLEYNVCGCQVKVQKGA